MKHLSHYNLFHYDGALLSLGTPLPNAAPPILVTICLGFFKIKFHS